MCGHSRSRIRDPFTPDGAKCADRARHHPCRCFQRRIRSMTATQTSRTAVVVTNNPERDALDVIIESSDIDVALFESPANAYTRIKREKPSLVIVDLSF